MEHPVPDNRQHGVQKFTIRTDIPIDPKRNGILHSRKQTKLVCIYFVRKLDHLSPIYMLKLSKKVEYGLIALLHLDSLTDGKVEAAKAIADQYNVPSDLLGKVLQALSRPGYIDSVHGAKGGYRLSRALEEITLGQVIEAIDGPIRLAKCGDDATEQCDQFCNCNIREPVQRVQAHLDRFMQEIHLASFRYDPNEAQTAGTMEV